MAKPKLVIGMRTNSGYTLIEILVVLVIIGVTLSFALLSFGDFGAKRQIIVSAEQFMTYIRFLEQQAILQNKNFKIQLAQNHYQVFRYAAHTWEAMPEKSIFHTRYLHHAAVARLYLNVTSSKQTGIMIYAAGQISPFKLYLGSKHEDNLVTIIGEPNGALSLQVKKS